MRRRDYQRVAPGLYEVTWRSGGTSTAAVGMTKSGDRWFAPTNWVSPVERLASTELRDIESMRLLREGMAQ